MDSSLEVRAYSSLSPFPSQFHFHTYSHPPGTGGGWCSLNAGNWLSLWSPVYFPPLPLPPFRPHHPASLHEQLGNLQQNTAVMSLPRTELWPGLPCLALPRPASPRQASTWGTLSWKERLVGLLVQKRGRGDCLPPSSPTLAPDSVLEGPGLADLAGAPGHPHERPPV